MLFLLFDAANSTYAVPANRIVEVVPRVDLRPLAHMPPYLAGLLDHGSGLIPVIDLNILLGSSPSPLRLGTRILLARIHLPDGTSAILGLIGQDMDRLHEATGQETAESRSREPGQLLGRVVKWEDTLAQQIELDFLLPEDLCTTLYKSLLEPSA